MIQWCSVKLHLPPWRTNYCATMLARHSRYPLHEFHPIGWDCLVSLPWGNEVTPSGWVSCKIKRRIYFFSWLSPSTTDGNIPGLLTRSRQTDMHQISPLNNPENLIMSDDGEPLRPRFNGSFSHNHRWSGARNEPRPTYGTVGLWNTRTPNWTK